MRTDYNHAPTTRKRIRSAVAEGSSSGNPRRIRRIPSLGPSLPRLTSRRNMHLHSTTIPQPRANHNSTPTTTQPSFVSNPRTISAQPSHIRDSPTPTVTQPCEKARRTYHRRAVKAYFRAGPFTRASISHCPADGCWSRCRRSAVASGLASDAAWPPPRSARCRVRDVPTDTSARRQSAHPRR